MWQRKDIIYHKDSRGSKEEWRPQPGLSLNSYAPHAGFPMLFPVTVSVRGLTHMGLFFESTVLFHMARLPPL